MRMTREELLRIIADEIVRMKTEVKRNTEIVPEQMHHLIDEEKCAMTEHRFGTITGRYVIYRGPAEMVDGVQYLNVEEYLCAIRA